MSAWLDRQQFLGADSDRILGDLTVGVVGLGGGGSHVVQQLAHIGVGHFRLFDPQRIDASNLNRLIGATARDVARAESKATIARRVVRGIHPRADLIAVRDRWQHAADPLRECDVIVGCVDTFAERAQLERQARRSITPYIDIGMDVGEFADGHSIGGQVAASMPGGPCLWCLNVLHDERMAAEAARYGSAGDRPQVVWPNGVLASLAVGAVIQLACPWNPGVCGILLQEYDGDSQTVCRSTRCDFVPAVCPHFPAGTSVGDPWFAHTG